MGYRMFRTIGALGLVLGFFFLSTAGAAPLPTVEVTEYQGIRLGSVKDFRENSIRGVQKIDPARYRLVLDGLVEKPQSLSLEQVARMPRSRKVVRIDCVEGWSVTALWEGVLVSDLLDLAKARPSAKIAIFHAVDGYTTSLPLDYLVSKKILLADTINGIVLPPANGYPFQLVAEAKWGYKWIRWVNRIELSDNTAYRGTWEKQGYSNNGDASGPMFGD
ncbi:MAG TPA: molybdopterin-dependent oxidoreductase [Synergistales bacterium]|nr:molybdopterin-dependent oxidoreductase [Synergistales bacterium]